MLKIVTEMRVQWALCTQCTKAAEYYYVNGEPMENCFNCNASSDDLAQVELTPVK
jgi:hypothetical protein